jgi:hypothetical protein
MTSPTTVVLLFGSTSDPITVLAAAQQSTDVTAALTDAVGGEVLVSAIAFTKPSVAIPGISTIVVRDTTLRARILSATGITALTRTLLQSPAGRLLASLGPADQSRVFWRAVAHDPEALALLQSVEIIIACDLQATLAAWTVVRRGTATSAWHGLPAALRKISRAPR